MNSPDALVRAASQQRSSASLLLLNRIEASRLRCWVSGRLAMFPNPVVCPRRGRGFILPLLKPLNGQSAVPFLLGGKQAEIGHLIAFALTVPMESSGPGLRGPSWPRSRSIPQVAQQDQPNDLRSIERRTRSRIGGPARRPTERVPLASMPCAGSASAAREPLRQLSRIDRRVLFGHVGEQISVSRPGRKA